MIFPNCVTFCFRLFLIVMGFSSYSSLALAQGCQPLGDGCDFRAGKPMTAPLGQDLYPSARIALKPEFGSRTQLSEIESIVGKPKTPLKPGNYSHVGSYASVSTAITPKTIRGRRGYTIKPQNRPGYDFILYSIDKEEYLAIEIIFGVPHARWLQTNDVSGSFSLHNIDCAKLSTADNVILELRSNLCLAKTAKEFVEAANIVRSRASSSDQFDFYSPMPDE